MRLQPNLRSATVALSACFLIAGCATQGATEATIATDELMTHDGLYPVSNSRADAAWARPDMDISAYSKIMLQGVGVQYRPGGAKRSSRATTRSQYYEVTPDQKKRFEKVLAEKFREELAKSTQFTIVSEPGPDVLLIKGGLIDVVSYVPPDQPGRHEIFLDKIGEATLVLEISDSVSDAVIARVVDRRAAEEVKDGFQRSNRATNTAEVRRLAGIWGRILREQLDHYAAKSPAIAESTE